MENCGRFVFYNNIYIFTKSQKQKWFFYHDNELLKPVFETPACSCKSVSSQLTLQKDKGNFLRLSKTFQSLFFLLK